MGHLLDHNTDQVMQQCDGLFIEIIDFNDLMNIGKFYQFCPERESFDKLVFTNGNGDNVMHFKIYIYRIALFVYWLMQLLLKFEGKLHIVWDKHANEASMRWLRYLIHNHVQ